MTPQYNESSCIWCNQTSVELAFQITFLSTFSVMGIVGNSLFISSILFAKTANKLGNMFLINLALTDLVVTGVCFPPVIFNVANRGINVMSDGVCTFLGFLLLTSCTCSVGNLLAIATNRYVAVVHQQKYRALFSKRNILWMVIFIWIWAVALSMPTVLGWTNVRYNEDAAICAWDDSKSRSFSIFVIAIANFLPVTGIAFCYYNIYKAIQSRGKWVRSLSAVSAKKGRKDRSLKNEKALMKTLLITVCFFIAFWFPYGITVIYGSDKVEPLQKKLAKTGSDVLLQIFAWLAMSSSSINFIIYGITNPSYRRGYKEIFIQLFCWKDTGKNNQV